MEILDNRKVDADGEAKQADPVEQYDDFKPTLEGFQPINDAVLLRELKLPDDSLIATPDAYAEPCLYCEVINSLNQIPGVPDTGRAVVRILKGIGTTVVFSDAAPGQRYFTVNYQDIIGVWGQQ